MKKPLIFAATTFILYLLMIPSMVVAVAPGSHYGFTILVFTLAGLMIVSMILTVIFFVIEVLKLF